MRKSILVYTTAIFCCGWLSCNSDTRDTSTTAKPEQLTLDKKWARSFIDSINHRFSEQIAAGDSVTIASHYWPDAELLLDNSDAVKGKTFSMPGAKPYAWELRIHNGYCRQSGLYH